MDPRALDILLAEPVSGGGTRTVQKDGLHVEGGIYIAAELGPLVGERVQVRRDPADYGRVYVFQIGPNDTMGAFVCIAEDPVRTGVDREEVAREARRLAREADKEARKWARDLAEGPPAGQPRSTTCWRMAAAEAESVIAFPAKTEKHESDGVAAAVAAQDAADAADTPSGATQDGHRRSGTDFSTLADLYEQGEFYNARYVEPKRRTVMEVMENVHREQDDG